MAKIAITFEPKVVDPYNLGDSWLVEQDLSSGKVIGVYDLWLKSYSDFKIDLKTRFIESRAIWLKSL